MRLARLLLPVTAFASLFSLGAPAQAEPTATEVKAAFLPRFARYVTWPASAVPRAGEPFVLCLIGGDPFRGAVEQAARSQSVDGRRIVVRRLDSAAGADGCQIAFVSGSASRTRAQLLAAIGGKPVLTVTDATGGDARGVIHFVTSGGHVRFFIDEAGASRRGLSVSSRLLALAVGVKQR